MHNDNNKFSYTYSAPTEAERREIESIRRQYKADATEGKESRVDRLRSLHSRVVGSATAAALAAGIIGVLIFGLGMALVLEFNELILGIIVSAVGIIPISLSYPLYNLVIRRGKKQYGEEIIRLSDELLREEN